MSEVVDPDNSSLEAVSSTSLNVSQSCKNMNNQAELLSKQRMMLQYIASVSLIRSHGSSPSRPGIECQIEDPSLWIGSRLWYIAYRCW